MNSSGGARYRHIGVQLGEMEMSSRVHTCQAIPDTMKVLDVDALPAVPPEALGELSRAESELEMLLRERV